MNIFLAAALSVVLSAGPGNDTAPAWSPDGATLAYVSDASGTNRLCLLDVKTRAVRTVETGAGAVFQPAWTPDGAIVFSRYRPNGTAFETKKDSPAALCVWRDGAVSPLPADPRPGRDYAPCVARDGAVCFTTTRGLDTTDAAIARLAPGAAAPVRLVGGGQKEEGCVSPDVSPDGRLLAYAYLDGLYSAWRLAVSPLADPSRRLLLTPRTDYACSPRFSPDGRRLAYAGFRAGETGWGVFVQDLARGATLRLDTGLGGNSRAPAWSPDGRYLAFENNATGRYRICLLKAPEPHLFGGVATSATLPASALGRDALVASAERTGTGRDALVASAAPADTFAFGDGDFHIRARVKVDALATGQFLFFLRVPYAEHPLGLQIYLDGKRLPTFSTRAASDGRFVMVQGRKPFPFGREVELLCVREHDGRLSLFVDGALAAASSHGALLTLGHPKMPVKAKELLSADCFTGLPAEVLRHRATREELFGASPGRAGRATLPVSAVSPGGTQFIASTPPASAAPPHPFEALAFADSLDFGDLMDSETADGNLKILDHILETGADTVLWRTGAGATTRYPSAEEPAAYCPAELRRLPDNRAYFGFLRYPDAQPDILRLVADACAARGVRFGTHSPLEETHWTSWTFGVWNAEHPQFWSRMRDGTPWAGRCSLAFDEVLAHKLRLADEILAYGSKDYFFDCWRNGGWDASFEYVEPELRRWRATHGDAPPEGAAWRAHVFETTHRFIRALSARVRARGARFLLGVPRPDDVPGEDGCMTFRGIDWRACVDAGDVDGLIVMEPLWDAKRPFESTRDIYRRLRARCAGKCRVYFPVAAYDFCGKGIPSYCKATGKPFADVVEILTRMAFEEGGDGITLECVDYNNYPPAARQRLRTLLPRFRARP